MKNSLVSPIPDYEDAVIEVSEISYARTIFVGVADVSYFLCPIYSGHYSNSLIL